MDENERTIQRLAISEEEFVEVFGAPQEDVITGYLAPPEVNRRLSRAEELIARGEKEEAREILRNMRRYTVKNPRYWWVVAQSSLTKKQTIAALKRVLVLQPSHQDAWNILRKIDTNEAERVDQILRPRKQPSPKKRARRIRTLRLVVFALIAAIILSLIAIFAMSTGLIL